MRSKVTFLLLALNLALFGYLLVSKHPWSATSRIEENRRRVLGPEAANLSALTITTRPAPDAPPGSTATTFRLERRGEAWFLATPLDWPANDFAVRRILNELQFLEHETSFSVADLARNGQSLADYGLDQPRLEILATPTPPPAGSTTPPSPAFTLRLGASTAVGNRLYVLSPDGARVHVVPQSFGAAFGTDPAALLAELRSDRLFTIPVFEARALTLQSGAASMRTRLRRDQSRWAFEAPITTRAAKTPVELLINDLNALRVARFLPGEAAASPEATGLAVPRLRLTLEGNSRRETLLLGLPASPAAPGAETVELHALLDDRTTPFTVAVPAAVLATLDQAQTDLRDRRVLAFDPARVTAVKIAGPEGAAPGPLHIQKLDSNSGGAAAWRLSSAALANSTRADPTLVAKLLGNLQLIEAAAPRPKASPFVSDAPSRVELENLGFNRPERTVTLELAAPESSTTPPLDGPATLVLELAQPGGTDPGLYARVAGQPFLYAVPPETLLLLDIAPLSYRDRELARLPEATRITRLVIRSTASPDAPLLLDHTVSDTPPPPAIASLLASLRDLRAGRIVREGFPATVPVDGVEKPWAYRLEATLAPPGDGPLVLSIAARAGGGTQLAGSERLGLVFSLEQSVVDALWSMLQPAAAP